MVMDQRLDRSGIESVLGPLEVRVLEACWAADGPVTVRDLTGAFPGVAYTTVMTTADRLFRKGLLTRVKSGRRFLYTARWSRRELELELAGSALASLLPGDRGALRPVISMFVDEVSRRDASMLDELEALIRRKREER
jgi:predicted transcriptional regulator